MRKRTLRVRTVMNRKSPESIVRRLAPLLVILFILPSLSGCLGGFPVTWGEGNGEYHATLEDGESGAPGVTISNRLGTPGELDEWRKISGCEGNSEAAPQTVKISGYLLQSKIFENPAGTEAAGTASLVSWVIKMMSYDDALEQEPGSLYFSVKTDSWITPTTVQGYEAVENSEGGDTRQDEFPFANWAVLGLVPSNENLFDALMQLEGNQAIEIEGWFLHGLSWDKHKNGENQGGWVDSGPIQRNAPVNEDCNIVDSNESTLGPNAQLVVKSISYGDERVVSSEEKYVAGDVPFFGRGLYTTILLVSIVASFAMFIYSRNQLMLSADSQAQSMLSEQQMRAGKAARHEAARHEARMEAVARSKEEDFTGRPTKKSAGVAKFDINAALSEQGPGASTSHYVAGSSVVATDEAEAMDDMIADMQKEQAFEQELQEKGLRNIIEGLPKGGRRSAGGSGRPAPKVAEPKVESKPKSRKTRKTKSQEVEESEPEVEERRVDPDVNDEGDFSDFSL